MHTTLKLSKQHVIGGAIQNRWDSFPYTRFNWNLFTKSLWTPFSNDGMKNLLKDYLTKKTLIENLWTPFQFNIFSTNNLTLFMPIQQSSYPTRSYLHLQQQERRTNAKLLFPCLKYLYKCCLIEQHVLFSFSQTNQKRRRSVMLSYSNF